MITLFPASSNHLSKSNAKNGYLLDLDGTLASMGKVLPGAITLLEMLKQQFVLVSNNAEHTPSELEAYLKVIGLNVPSERIILAGSLALDEISTRVPGAQVLVLGSRSLRHYAQAKGLKTDFSLKAVPDIVFLGRDRHFSYKKLALAANAMRSGAKLIVANPDLFHPGMEGAIVPETGALLQAILACTGSLPYEVFGKPEPALFLKALDHLGVSANQAVMIGDNPSTDGEGALSLGIGYLKVGEEGLPEIIRRLEQGKGNAYQR